MKSNEEILRTFYQVERIPCAKGTASGSFAGHRGPQAAHEIRNPKSEE